MRKHLQALQIHTIYAGGNHATGLLVEAPSLFLQCFFLAGNTKRLFSCFDETCHKHELFSTELKNKHLTLRCLYNS